MQYEPTSLEADKKLNPYIFTPRFTKIVDVDLHV